LARYFRRNGYVRRQNPNIPKKKAIRHQDKIESFGKPAAQLTDAGGCPMGRSHFQGPTQELIRL